MELIIPSPPGQKNLSPILPHYCNDVYSSEFPLLHFYCQAWADAALNLSSFFFLVSFALFFRAAKEKPLYFFFFSYTLFFFLFFMYLKR